jgi:hypothetical protein
MAVTMVCCRCRWGRYYSICWDLVYGEKRERERERERERRGTREERKGMGEKRGKERGRETWEEMTDAANSCTVCV